MGRLLAWAVGGFLSLSFVAYVEAADPQGESVLAVPHLRFGQVVSRFWQSIVEPSHPKMGVQVKETSERAAAILLRKRAAG